MMNLRERSENMIFDFIFKFIFNIFGDYGESGLYSHNF